MRFKSSNQSHRLIGNMEDGDEFIETLTKICDQESIMAGEIRAFGSFDHVELVRFDPDSKQYITCLDAVGQFDIISLQGNISRLGDQSVLRVDVVLNGMGLLGPQMVAGQLRAATVTQVEFIMDIFDDIHWQRRLDPQSGLLVVDKIESVSRHNQNPQDAPKIESPAPVTPAVNPAPTPMKTTPQPAATMSWAQAANEAESNSNTVAQKPIPARSSSRRTTSIESVLGDEESEMSLMKPGDMLDHPKLGMCRIMRIEEDEYLHIRLPRGKISKLALEVCEIRFKGQENGRNVFQVRVRR